MAESKKVVWQPLATSQLREIVDFYDNRNDSTKYTERLLKEIDHMLSLIDDNWQIGEKVNKENVRRMVVENFLIYYLVTPNSVDVLSIRDGRRKPKKFKMSEIIRATPESETDGTPTNEV